MSSLPSAATRYDLIRGTITKRWLHIDADGEAQRTRSSPIRLAIAAPARPDDRDHIRPARPSSSTSRHGYRSHRRAPHNAPATARRCSCAAWPVLPPPDPRDRRRQRNFWGPPVQGMLPGFRRRSGTDVAMRAAASQIDHAAARGTTSMPPRCWAGRPDHRPVRPPAHPLNTTLRMRYVESWRAKGALAVRRDDRSRPRSGEALLRRPAVCHTDLHA
jgi:hypothetical protein